MSSYGTTPGEAGTHCLGVPVPPGMAWSEGWASFYQAEERGSDTYYDKQNGTFFWLDFSAGRYGSGGSFVRPSGTGGLVQALDENWLAAALYALALDPAVPDRALLRALASPHMNQAVFPRGYTAHRWTTDPNSCQIGNWVDTGRPAPIVADLLDALRCGGIPEASVNAAMAPYPYPASAPICP
jgi:hypothetical protein